MIKAVVFIVGIIVGVSVIYGVLVALAVVVWAQNIAAAVALIRNGYYLLVGLLPIALWLGVYVTHTDVEYQQAFDSMLRALLTTIQSAVIGSLLGAGPAFLAAVIYVPVILAQFSIEEYGAAVRNEIIWSQLILAVGAALLAAIPLGMWGYSTGSGRDSN